MLAFIPNETTASSMQQEDILSEKREGSKGKTHCSACMLHTHTQIIIVVLILFGISPPPPSLISSAQREPAIPLFHDLIVHIQNEGLELV